MRRAVLLTMLGGALAPLLLVRVPLLDGLTYELAIVIALLAFAAAAVAGSDAGRCLADPYRLRWKLLDRSPRERLEPRLGGWLAGLGGAVLVAGVVAAAWSARTGCAWERGIGLYLLTTLPAVPLGLGAGVYARAVAPGSRLGRGAVLALGTGAAAGLTIYEVVAGPRAVFHNLVLGIISNTAYLGLDETVRIASSDLLHRAATLVVAAALVAAALARGASTGRADRGVDADRVRELLGVERRSARLRLGLCVGLLATMASIGDPFGFGSGLRSVERALAARHVTEHFVLRYRPGSRVERMRVAVAADCEWAHAEMARRLGLDPRDPGGKTEVFIYEDDAEQSRLTGASNYLFAKPWLVQLHTRLSDSGELVAFEHELVHVLAARFGLPGIGVSARYGLIEGLAEGVAGRYAERPWRHEEVAAALRLGLLPPAAEVIGNLGFAARDARTSYLAAASFSGFLLDSYGAEPMRRVYARGDFAAVYGRDLTRLDAEWRAYLRPIEVSERALAHSSRAFSSELTPPFFRQLCARLGRRGPPPTMDARPVPGSPAFEVALSILDRAAALGPLLGRDAALAESASLLLGAGRADAAAFAVARRAELGVAPGALDAALRGATREPRMMPAAVALSSGWFAPLAGGEADLGCAAEPLCELAVERVTGGSESTLMERALSVGGCGDGFQELESYLLLHYARRARRDGRIDDARSLIETALAVAPAATDAFEEARAEVARDRAF